MAGFFAFIHIWSPHAPYLKKNEEKEFLEDRDIFDIEMVRKKINKCYYQNNNSIEGWEQKELDILQGLYDGNLKQADAYVGEIYNKLKQLGLEETRCW